MTVIDEETLDTRPIANDSEPHAMPLIRVRVDDVIVPAGHRPRDDAKVAEFKKSIAQIGLKTPITIRVVKRGTEPFTVTDHVLVAGAYALMRVPDRLTETERTDMKNKLLGFQGAPFHARVAFIMLPKQRSEGAGADDKDCGDDQR